MAVTIQVAAVQQTTAAKDPRDWRIVETVGGSSCCKSGCDNDSCRDSDVDGVGKEAKGGCDDGTHIMKHSPCSLMRQFMHARFAQAQAQRLHRVLTPLQLQHGPGFGAWRVSWAQSGVVIHSLVIHANGR